MTKVKSQITLLFNQLQFNLDLYCFFMERLALPKSWSLGTIALKYCTTVVPVRKKYLPSVGHSKKKLIIQEWFLDRVNTYPFNLLLLVSQRFSNTLHWILFHTEEKEKQQWIFGISTLDLTYLFSYRRRLIYTYFWCIKRQRTKKTLPLIYKAIAFTWGFYTCVEKPLYPLALN